MRVGSKHSDETKAKMAAARMGRTLTDEHKENITAAQRGELSHFWRGDEVGNLGAHFRAQKTLVGQPCAHADDTCKGRLECAFNHDTPAEFVKVDPSTGCRFSPRPEDYIRLCLAPHRRYDNKKGCPDGS